MNDPRSTANKKRRRVTMRYQCIYCLKYFNTFNYAWWHMQDCHRKAIETQQMTYPALLRYPFTVELEKMPGKRGYLR